MLEVEKWLAEPRIFSSFGNLTARVGRMSWKDKLHLAETTSDLAKSSRWHAFKRVEYVGICVRNCADCRRHSVVTVGEW